MTTRRDGFTLVELLITVILLSIGILAMLGTVSSMQKFQTLNRQMAEMSDLTHSKIDELRAVNLATSGVAPTVSPGGSLTQDRTDYNDLARGASGILYRRRWLVVGAASDLPTATVRVTVRVFPVSGNGPSREVTTLFYDPPNTP